MAVVFHRIYSSGRGRRGKGKKGGRVNIYRDRHFSPVSFAWKCTQGAHINRVVKRVPGLRSHFVLRIPRPFVGLRYGLVAGDILTSMNEKSASNYHPYLSPPSAAALAPFLSPASPLYVSPCTCAVQVSVSLFVSNSGRGCKLYFRKQSFRSFQSSGE